MEKAKKTGFVIYGKYSNIVEYEYRNHKYEVEYANDLSYSCSPAKVQHKDAQDRIDKLIEKEANPKEYKYEDSAEYGFDLFWKYIEG